MRDIVSPLYGASLSEAALLMQPTQWKCSVLGALCFSPEMGAHPLLGDMPCMHIPMQRLDGGDVACEIWRGSAQPTRGQHGAIQYRHDDDALFGVMVLSETLFEISAGKTPLQQATESAYRQVFTLLDTLRYPYLYRVWNYMADINAQTYGLERYRQFNLGRQDAFLAHGRDVVGNVPAACALGFDQTTRGPLTIGFLAGRIAPRRIENPRQISAYQYPQEYGPRSPTFSRASLVQLGQDEVLFISGTASIVGHATVHPADVVAQTRETLANIEAVLAEANRLAKQPRFDLVSLHYKIYVRHPGDLAQIRAELTHRVGEGLKAVYLQADVCRQDLLVEIEATAGHPLAYLSTSRS